MIVLDASTLVSATFNSRGVPAQAVQRALREDRVAISEPVMIELLDVLHRPGVARFLKTELLRNCSASSWRLAFRSSRQSE